MNRYQRSGPIRRWKDETADTFKAHRIHFDTRYRLLCRECPETETTAMSCRFCNTFLCAECATNNECPSATTSRQSILTRGDGPGAHEVIKALRSEPAGLTRLQLCDKFTCRPSCMKYVLGRMKASKLIRHIGGEKHRSRYVLEHRIPIMPQYNDFATRSPGNVPDVGIDSLPDGHVSEQKAPMSDTPFAHQTASHDASANVSDTIEPFPGLSEYLGEISDLRLLQQRSPSLRQGSDSSQMLSLPTVDTCQDVHDFTSEGQHSTQIQQHAFSQPYKIPLGFSTEGQSSMQPGMLAKDQRHMGIGPPESYTTNLPQQVISHTNQHPSFPMTQSSDMMRLSRRGIPGGNQGFIGFGHSTQYPVQIPQQTVPDLYQASSQLMPHYPDQVQMPQWPAPVSYPDGYDLNTRFYRWTG